MTLTVEAIFEKGVLKPKQPLTLAEGTQVRLIIDTPDGDPLEEVIGICDEGPEVSLAARHDEFIYGLKSRNDQQP
jgi:predicted DNA-binding antitoxin AbrB/MazE fold protein